MNMKYTYMKSKTAKEGAESESKWLYYDFMDGLLRKIPSSILKTGAGGFNKKVACTQGSLVTKR